MLLNAAKYQGYSFWVINGKPIGGGGKITPVPLPKMTHKISETNSSFHVK